MIACYQQLDYMAALWLSASKSYTTQLVMSVCSQQLPYCPAVLLPAIRCCLATIWPLPYATSSSSLTVALCVSRAVLWQPRCCSRSTAQLSAVGWSRCFPSPYEQPAVGWSRIYLQPINRVLDLKRPAELSIIYDLQYSKLFSSAMLLSWKKEVGRAGSISQPTVALFPTPFPHCTLLVLSQVEKLAIGDRGAVRSSGSILSPSWCVTT
jgi:hypothetical protein